MNDPHALAGRRVRDDWDERVASVESRQLQNGLVVSLLPTDNAQLSALELRVAVGSGDEARGERGLAHFLEHLMFRGSRRYPDGQFDEIAEASGIQANAWTWLDTTAYTALLPNEALTTLLDLEADRLAGLNITDEVFETERKVVLNERELTLESDPLALARVHLEERLFSTESEPGPYAHPTIGMRDELEALHRDDVLRFHTQHYRPGNIDLLVASGLPAETVFGAIEHAFGDISPNRATPATPRPSQQPLHSAWQETLAASFSEPRVFIAWPYPAAAESAELARHDLLWEILLHERGGRLMKALEIDAELVLDQNADASAHRLRHAMFYEAIPRQGVNTEALVERIFGVLEEVATAGVRDEELRAAKLSLMTHYARLSPPWRTLRMLGDAHSDAGEMRALVSRLDALLHCDADALRKCATLLADRANAAILIVQPRGRRS